MAANKLYSYIHKFEGQELHPQGAVAALISYGNYQKGDPVTLLACYRCHTHAEAEKWVAEQWETRPWELRQ